MIGLHWPWVFLLLPAPFLVYWLIPAKKAKPAALQVPDLNLWAGAQSSLNQPKPRLSSLLLPTLIWLCLLMALSRPYMMDEALEMPISGRDLMLAVDISGSMKMEDMSLSGRSVTRLLAVKNIVNEFITKRQSDRIGLVLFGSEAYLQAPLTFDTKTVNTLLLEAQIGLAGENTAIGDAIGLITKIFLNKPEQDKVLVLLTDGANTSGVLKPVQAAELAAKAGIKIYTIGIGATRMEVPSFFGTRTVNPSRDLDEKSLQKIAKLTGGKYFRAKNTQELAEIYRIIESLEPIEQDPQILRPQKSLSHWFLVFAIALLSLMQLQPWLELFIKRLKGRQHV